MSNIIEDGLERIIRDGWWRGPTHGNSTGTCMLLSIDREDRAFEVESAIDCIAAEIPDAKRSREATITAFNDNRATSFEDMALVMKCAAGRLDEVLAS